MAAMSRMMAWPVAEHSDCRRFLQPHNLKVELDFLKKRAGREDLQNRSSHQLIPPTRTARIGPAP
jgi:hypothetical protein